MKNNIEIGVFAKDKNIKGSYIPLNPQIFPFPFLKIEPTKTESVKKNGAELIIQSFAKIKKSDKEKSKILHSGIIRIDDCNDEVYFGDNINLKTNQKDFFILSITNTQSRQTPP